MRTLAIVLSFVVVTLVVGCGKSDPFNRQPVAGTVKYKGKEIKYGSIRFEPAEGQKTAESAEIRDGRYELAAGGGLSPGKYKVYVNAPDRWELPANAAPGQEGPPPKETLPPAYSQDGKLDATINVVKGGDKNDVSFDLK